MAKRPSRHNPPPPPPPIPAAKLAPPSGASSMAAAASGYGSPAQVSGGRFEQIGVTGLRVASGFIYEEFQPELLGQRGQKIFAEMASNDSTVGALLAAITWILRRVKWEAEPAKDVPEAEAQAEADFALGLFDDMSHTWADLICETLTFLVFGWSYHEIVYKRRVGPLQKDPTKRSKFDDGRIGIRKIAPRAQESLERWEMQDDGGIFGMWQNPFEMSLGKPGLRFIPVERSVLFRTTSRKNSPEGVSVLRTAYRSWYFLKRIQEIEAIGIERELAGLPVVRIPKSYMTSENPADVAIYAAYKQMARDLKFNEQGGLVIPSDVYVDGDGKPTAMRLVEVELLKSAGARSIDTVAIKTNYQRDIARSVLADFVLLGTDKGAYNLSESKTTLFMRAMEALLDCISEPINRFVLPRVWDLNALDRALMPELRPGRIAPTDLKELGQYLKDIAGAGDTLFPDEDLSAYLHEEGGLPPRSADLTAMIDDQAQIDAEAAALGLDAQQQAIDNPPVPGAPPVAAKPGAKKPPAKGPPK